ncbi:TIGR01459 family HAD-type hydrolase [Amylibacter sp.]|nr:TIGR01459 family HAD-type hydrolase [Amylibacter sp.]
MTNIINKLSEISTNYDAIFCDLWGCLHNGIAPFEEAINALDEFSNSGGIVHLLTNSPRPSSDVYKQLDKIGVPRNIYQGITASGDASREALISGIYGAKIFHIGPSRDEIFFKGLNEDNSQLNIQIDRVPFNKAEGIVCTGLFDDDVETPFDYTEQLIEAKNRGLKMLCANPDIQVDKGTHRIYCAGAIAKAFNDMGGTADNYGKPHSPIYNLARVRLNKIAGKVIPDKKILCVGDGIKTDIHGAVMENLDSLFVTGGLAAEETNTFKQPEASKLGKFLAASQLTPTYSIGHLR